MPSKPNSDNDDIIDAKIVFIDEDVVTPDLNDLVSVSNSSRDDSISSASTTVGSAASNDANSDGSSQLSTSSFLGIPSAKTVYDTMVYGLSVPERAIRVSAALAGGAVRESAELLLPQAFTSSRAYGTFLGQMLDFCTDNLGGVEREVKPESDGNASEELEGFVARKTVGNFVELAGIAAFHVSPIVVLAVFSDLAYGSNAYLKQLAAELKREGLISENSTIDNTAQLLEEVSNFAGHTSGNLNLPPLSIDGLKETVQQTQEKINRIDPTKLYPQSEIDNVWRDMQTIAKQEDLNLIQISGSITMYTLNQVATIGKTALSSVRVAGNMLDQNITQHYRDALQEIQEKGFYALVADASRPYVRAVWKNFYLERPTVTEDVVSGKMAARVWSGIRGWFNKDDNSR